MYLYCHQKLSLFQLNLRFTFDAYLHLKGNSLRPSMQQTNQNKTKFQTKNTKLTENNINSSIFDKLRKTETQNDEGCCSTDDPHPSRQ